jgi:hypothetical protein
MEGFKEGNECGGFRGAEVFAIGRHVASALDHLTDELVLSKVQSNPVQSGPTLTSFVIE